MRNSTVQPDQCQRLFEEKVGRVLRLLAPFAPPEPALYASPPLGYRLRAEVRMWHDGDALDYVMFPPGKPNEPIVISDFPIAASRITDCMPVLQQSIQRSSILRNRLFQVEFLSSCSGNLLITLIYHRPLDAEWELAATALADQLNCDLIGRSRKQKVTIGKDWIDESLQIQGSTYEYRQPEQCFTQPNGSINRHMIEWLLTHTPPCHTDLLELYCGVGNFTLPLAHRFRRVLATELSKRATAAAAHNATANHIGNLELARLSAAEMSQAMAGDRPFRRLSALKEPLSSFEFETLLVDPPRAGLDSDTLGLAKGFARILYISCNPTSLIENLAELNKTHGIEALAFFDQFPYTDHLESGVILKRRPI